MYELGPEYFCAAMKRGFLKKQLLNFKFCSLTCPVKC